MPEIVFEPSEMLKIDTGKSKVNKSGYAYVGRKHKGKEITWIKLKQEKWNENVETCSDCGIQWKKRGNSCPVCYAPPETNDAQQKGNARR